MARRPQRQGSPPGSLIIDVIEIAYYDGYECSVANAYARHFGPRLRRHGADPFTYFEWVFEKLMHNPAPEELENLLPANWLKARPAACQTIESRVA